MTHISTMTEQFAQYALEGFCSSNSHIVQHVFDGVMRRKESRKRKVAVVIGGGSGHYPAFVGYVGTGFADAAVVGDIFASPSTRQICDIVRLASKNAGVLLGFGNYAGDVLNFGFAAERLRGEGLDVRVLGITDDIASAPIGRETERRGVCGDLPVFKIAGASAERGDDIDTVERLARLANSRTHSFGIAFGGCTLPGADKPLFTVKKGMMAIGLGIHGEPGIETRPLENAEDIAMLLVDRILLERPQGSFGRAAVIVNGLGGTKYEELYVLWNYVRKALLSQNITPVIPLVGEYITSLDMEGCSLTLPWLDDELEPLWRAACDTAALHLTDSEQEDRPASGDGPPVAVPEASVKATESGDARKAGLLVAEGVVRIAKMLAENAEELGWIDAQAGDGDHGLGMARGSAAAAKAAQEAVSLGAGPASVLTAAADAWADRAGGTSGAIWGLGLRSAASELSDYGVMTGQQAVRGARRALENIMEFGGAKVGDKTLVDALSPFVETLTEALERGGTLKSSWRKAEKAAQDAAIATAALSPKRGRAKPLAERSLGHRDAGAVSFAMTTKTILDLVEQNS